EGGARRPRPRPFRPMSVVCTDRRLTHVARAGPAGLHAAGAVAAVPADALALAAALAGVDARGIAAHTRLRSPRALRTVVPRRPGVTDVVAAANRGDLAAGRGIWDEDLLVRRHDVAHVDQQIAVRIRPAVARPAEDHDVGLHDVSDIHPAVQVRVT